MYRPSRIETIPVPSIKTNNDALCRIQVKRRCWNCADDRQTDKQMDVGIKAPLPQPLDHGSGTVCQPGFVSPTTTSENFVGSWSRFCSSDTAAHSDYFVLMRLLNTLTHSLTHSLRRLMYINITTAIFSISIQHNTKQKMQMLLLFKTSVSVKNCVNWCRVSN